jgi:hypothetical protein
VDDEVAELLNRGREALAAGDWRAARDRFEAATRLGDSAEALDGLAQALSVSLVGFG